MQRFFIADIHLNDNEPVITTGFLAFIEKLPESCELYILGDLFDYWIGDDEYSSLHQKIAGALSDLSRRGINVFFIHGNRDFLIGQHFAEQCQMQILPELSLIDQKSSPLLVLHGDLLCTDDKSYQKFRRKMHNHWLQRLFLMLPMMIRRKIANKLRGESQQYNSRKSEKIMDVNQQAVSTMMQQFQAHTMIHGHTHKPAIHSFKINNIEVKRMVLGAWHDGINFIFQDSQGRFQLYLLSLNINELITTFDQSILNKA